MSRKKVKLECAKKTKTSIQVETLIRLSKMVRMKHTPKKPKFREPEVTEEMIASFPRPPGRPRSDQALARQLIKDQIREILLKEREEAIQRRREIRQKERKNREADEREHRARKECRSIELRLRKAIEKREREQRRQREREHKALIEKEKALREYVREYANESELTDELQPVEKCSSNTDFSESGKSGSIEANNGKVLTEEETEQELAEQARREQEANEKRRKKVKLHNEMRRVKRKLLQSQWQQIERAIKYSGQENVIAALHRDAQRARWELIFEELQLERKRTKELFTKDNPMFEAKSLAIHKQMADPKMRAQLKALNKCPENRARLRHTALEMQRAIELYDMLEEDWELDRVSEGRPLDDRVTNNIAPTLLNSNELTNTGTFSQANEVKYWQYHLVKANDMDDPEYDLLLARFGSKPYYRWIFSGRQTHDPLKTFQDLNRTKGSHDSEYEVARQKFLQILGFHARYWYRTDSSDDVGVEISKLHRDSKKEYIGFMRIRCGGHRAEKHTDHKMHIVFHLLLGKVCFTLNKRPRIVNRGGHITVNPNSTYSISCLDRDQAAQFVFRISFEL